MATMGINFLVVLIGMSLFQYGECVECELPWLLYKDEQCIQLFSVPFQTYAEAREFCRAQAPENLRPSLLLIKDAEYQNFIESTVYSDASSFDSIWIGGYYNATNVKFNWEDGEAFGYVNWAPGHPRDPSPGTERCVEIRSPHVRTSKSLAQWYDVACGKRNLVVCQRSTTWTSDEIVYELVKLRKKVVGLD